MAKSQDKNNKKISRCGVFQIFYHLVWTPKRRASVLNGLIAEDLSEIIKNISCQQQAEIKAMEIMPDHVHLFVSCNPKISPHLLIKKIKGASSNILRKKYPQLLKLPCLWSSSYYCGTVGNVSDSVVQYYIENQKGK